MTAPLFSLEGRVAVVTGALGLLGREHCAALAEAGACVVVTDVDDGACQSYAGEVRAMTGKDALGMAADVTQPASVERLRDATLARFGTIDILVNNAAINDRFESPELAAEQSRFENYPLAMWQRSLDVNVTGTFLCSQILGGVMAEKQRGSIINIALTYGVVAPKQSLYKRPDGLQTFFKTAAYPTTKGAVLSFTRFLAAYWGERRVRVNSLSPGGVENGQEEWFVAEYSKQTPLARMARRDDYRGALIFLASEEASGYMTGANLVVNGGWTAW